MAGAAHDEYRHLHVRLRRKPCRYLQFIKGSLKPDQIRQNQYQRGIRKDIDNADEASASQVSATSA
jgi:hypothetical protein